MTEPPLWKKVYLGRWSTVYVNAGKIIGHLGCDALAFYDAAKLLPDHDKDRYETAVRDLCVYQKREQGHYELHQTARKVLRLVLGPAPDDPDYRRWWESRLVSVADMREQGLEPVGAEVPPSPLDPEKPKAKKPTAKKVRKK